MRIHLLSGRWLRATNYNGLFVQVAEPPAEMSDAEVDIPAPVGDMANLEFVGANDGGAFKSKGGR